MLIGLEARGVPEASAWPVFFFYRVEAMDAARENMLSSSVSFSHHLLTAGEEEEQPGSS